MKWWRICRVHSSLYSEWGVCVSLSFRGSETTEESRCVIFPGSLSSSAGRAFVQDDGKMHKILRCAQND